ncbi:MAG: hypothetical protein HC905_31800, partial [Bacteroidales bacterium]|nr:hypothetical protein [Bacteroidales bacterium]
VEVIFALFNGERRLGDFLAGTRLDFYIADRLPIKKGAGPYLWPVFIFFCLTVLTCWFTIPPISAWFTGDRQINPTKYNDAMSKKLANALTESYKTYCDSVSIRFYDNSGKDSLHFVSLLFYANQQATISDISYWDMKKNIVDTLCQKLPPESFILQGNIIFMNQRKNVSIYLSYNPATNNYWNNPNAPNKYQRFNKSPPYFP